MKKCTKCKQELEESQFSKNKSRKDGLHSSCKECNKSACKSHYLRNKEYYLDKAHNSRDSYLEWSRSLKKDKSCVKCGESHPACLQFHHVNPKDKSFTISGAISSSLSREAILEEIKKCIILCANCHFKFHAEEE